MTAPVFDRSLVIQRMARPDRPTASHGRQASGAGSIGITTPEAAPIRGDHDLNPELRPEGPLREAAVLVGLIEPEIGSGDLTVLLTRRSKQLKAHSGQVSFPGGQVDPDDTDAVDAALREAEEEVALPRDRVDVVGRLDTYVTRTGFRITPVVAMLRPPFDLRPDPGEVEEIFDVPLEFIVDPTNHEKHAREYQGRSRQFYVLPYRDYYIWGATAGMLVNLAEVLAS